jgi:prepilin-type N-terminal cleavage/methylation domain-containing protein
MRHNQPNNRAFTSTPVLVWFRKAKHIFSDAIILHKQHDASEVTQGRNFVKPKLVSGFTLVELLVVISIISLLSTVIFAVFSTGRVQAQDAKKKEEVHQVNNALELYRSNENKYPDNFCTDTNCVAVGTRTFPALSSADNSAGIENNDYHKSMRQLVANGTLASIPEDTATVTPYAYFNTGDRAIFFTSLTGGYGGTGVGTMIPGMTIQRITEGSYLQNQLMTDVCHTYIPGTTWYRECFVANDRGGGYADLYLYYVFTAPEYSEECYNTALLADEYKICLSEGVSAYMSEHPPAYSGSTDTSSCDTLFSDPLHPTTSPPYTWLQKYTEVSCPTDAPAFCGFAGEAYDTLSNVCYWPELIYSLLHNESV